MITPSPNAQTILEQLLRARKDGHRTLMVASGSAPWCLQVQSSLLALLPGKEVWRVSNHSTAETATCIVADKISQKLGQECDVLIWDGFSGIDPDGFAAAAGLIRAGGLLLLLLPPETELLAKKDPDYRRMCVDDAELAACSSHFLHRLLRHLRQAEDAIYLSEAEVPDPLMASPCSIALTTEFKPVLPTTDQCRALDAILALHSVAVSGVVLLSARRGRGKSSALGIASARMMGVRARIILSAASKQNAGIARLHFEREYMRLHGQPPAPDRLVFHAPDDLLQKRPDCDLLLIDEAAMLPVPMLIQLLKHYPKCAFATTTDGYEGSGQGFVLRFRAALARKALAWQQIEMEQPVRWADNDPLERAIDEALLLNPSQTVASPVQVRADACVIRWLEPAQLAADEALLQQLVSLLTEAHYQTRPSDLRMLLDHPRVQIAILRQGQTVLAALVLIAEGRIDTPGLAEGLLAGTRRPRGHLIPQALTQFSGDPRWLGLRSWRVMRIAVRPDSARQKLGSRLLTAMREHAEALGLDYLSTSFGLTATLLPFWCGNDYQLLRIGYKRDAASACHSAHMVRPLSPLAHALALEVRQRFAFLFQRLRASSFAALDSELAAQLPSHLTEQPLPALKPALLAHVSEGHRRIEDTMPELLMLLAEERVQPVIATLSETERGLLTLRVSECLSWQECARSLGLEGKKVAEKEFRQVIGRLFKY